MKVRNFTIVDAINALRCYPRHWTDNTDNYPEDLGVNGFIPADWSGTEKFEFPVWSWFSNEVLRSVGIKRLVQAYDDLGGNIKLGNPTGQGLGYDAELEDTDILNMIKGGLVPNVGNSKEFQLRRLGAHISDNSRWMWNKKVIDGEIPYDTPVTKSNMSEDLLYCYGLTNATKMTYIK